MPVRFLNRIVSLSEMASEELPNVQHSAGSREALNNETWFHGDISCDEAVARLSVAGTAGSFLVRYSDPFYIFSFIHNNNKIRHFKVPFNANFSLIKEFPDLNDEYKVMKKILSLKCQYFTKPVARPGVNLPTKVILEKRCLERIVCSICNFKAESKEHLNGHMNNHRFCWCKRCGVFFSMAYYSHHKIACDPNTTLFPCEHCRKFKGKFPKELKQHQQKCLQKKHRCSTCEKVFLSQEKLDFHYLRVHEKNCPCNICGKILGSRKAFIAHQKEMHNIGTELLKLFFCPKCEFKTYGKAVLGRHVKTHDKKTQLKCKICSFTSWKNTKYAQHLKTHENTKNTIFKNTIFIGY